MSTATSSPSLPPASSSARAIPFFSVGENVPEVTSPSAVPAGVRDRHVRPRDAPADGTQPAEHPGRPGLFLRAQRLVAPEVLLLPADGPAGPGLDGRDVRREVVPVQRVAHLGPQRVPRAQPARDDADCSPAAISASHGAGRLLRRHEFVATLTRVAGAAHDDRRSGEVATAKDM